MKNLGGAIIAIFTVTFIMTFVYDISTAEYGDLPQFITVLLASASNLVITGNGTIIPDSVILYLPVWLVAGIVMGPLSNPGWNTVRSTLWYGTILSILDTASILVIDPLFWNLPTRNLQLVIIFASGLLFAQMGLISAIPMAALVQKMRTASEAPIPERIVSTCTCGAVYKSRPMICAACGKPLEENIPQGSQ